MIVQSAQAGMLGNKDSTQNRDDSRGRCLKSESPIWWLGPSILLPLPVAQPTHFFKFWQFGRGGALGLVYRIWPELSAHKRAALWPPEIVHMISPTTRGTWSSREMEEQVGRGLGAPENDRDCPRWQGTHWT